MQESQSKPKLFFEVRNISKSFLGTQALKNVSLSVRAGQVHAVIGENGAGKSTLMNIISGKMQPDSGELLRDDKALHFRSPQDAHRAGIAMAPQELSLCPHLSVAENIVLGNQIGSFAINSKATQRLAEEHLAEIDDRIDPRRKVGELSAAAQQLVQITRATATHADILIFDEPTASLTDREAKSLFAFISRFRERGGAIFYISHRLDEILEYGDRISVLRDGAYITELDPRQTNKDEMVRHMAGRQVNRSALRSLAAGSQVGETVLKVQGLTRKREFETVSFELRRGEVLGVSGLIGSGRTELAKCLFGLHPADAGQVFIDGRKMGFRGPADAIKNGLVYLPEERKKEGIFPLLSVRENLCVAAFEQFKRFLGLDRRRMVDRTRENIRRIGIKTPGSEAPIKNLSGGNQQKVIIARWLLKKCRILILDEPTRGIDVRAKFEIQSFLRELTKEGLSIIYISSEMEEVLDVSDRIMVMHLGQVKGFVDADQATQEELLGVAMSLKEDLHRLFVKPITKKLTFVYVPKLAHPWYDEVRVGIEYGIAEEKKEGIEVEYLWDAPAQADVDQENMKIEAAISRQPDGLCVAVLDQARNGQLLDRAVQAKINVLTFNAFAGTKFPFVGRHDDVADGYDLAKYLAEAMAGKGKIAILSGSPTAPEHAGRVEGFKKALRDCGDFEIVFEEPDHDDLGQALSLTEQALQAHPDLNGILCSNASNPVGAARAVKNAGKAGKILIAGMDNLSETLEFVKQGVILVTKVQRQWDIGYWSVRYLVAMNKGLTIPRDHDTGASMITAETLKQI
jgi:ABC-type sugar transport system ATPase subunit/ABC-type sugar transport system substrate-binding protein